MGGAAVNSDAVPAEALVRDSDSDLLAGRLRHDGRIGNHNLGGGERAGRGELLVADGGDHHVAGQVAAERTCGRHHDRGEASLHVVGPAAVEAIAVDAGPKWIGHPVDADDVHVRIQEQRAAAAAAASMRGITFGQPGSTSATSTSRPRCSSQWPTNRAISASPAPPGTSRGLTESIDTQLGQEALRASSSMAATLPAGARAGGRRRRRRRGPERRPVERDVRPSGGPSGSPTNVMASQAARRRHGTAIGRGCEDRAHRAKGGAKKRALSAKRARSLDGRCGLHLVGGDPTVARAGFGGSTLAWFKTGAERAPARSGRCAARRGSTAGTRRRCSRGCTGGRGPAGCAPITRIRRRCSPSVRQWKS